MVVNQELGRRGFFWGFGGNIPPNTYSAALARGLPSKGEMRRASIHKQYDVRTGGRLGSNIPPNTYSAALARGLPSKGEM